MPAVFPTPRPDELFYSVVARHGDVMQFPNDLVLRKSVYGTRYCYPSVEFCTRLDALLKRLPPGGALTKETIIEDHTLFPYYAHALPPDRRERLKELLLSSEDGISRPSITSGASRHKPGLPLRLRYCETCVEEDRSGAKEVAYWHRVHQVTGVWVCPGHGTALTESDLERFDRASPREHISLERALLQGGQRISVPERYAPDLHGIALDSHWLLQNQPVDESGNWSFPSRFKAWCGEKGWTYPNSGNFRLSDIARALHSRYGKELLTSLGNGDPHLASRTKSWLKKIRLPRNSRKVKTASPLQYILAWRFLDLSAGQFFGTKPSPRPIAEERVLGSPCGNPVCPEYDPPVPRSLIDKIPSWQEHVVVSCDECGFTYKQQPDADNLRRVIKKTGPFWDAALGRLLEKGLSLVDVSARMGVCQGGIQKRAFCLGLWQSSWGEKRRAEVRESLTYKQRHSIKVRDRHRNVWLELRQQHPSAGRTGLKKLEGSTYHYLIHHDKAWYEKHAPMPRRARPVDKLYVDWEARDKNLRDDAEEAVEAILKEPGYPIRITLRSITRFSGQKTLRSTRDRGHLSLTFEYIDSVLESTNQHNARAVWHAANKIAEEGTIPTSNALAGRARLTWTRRRELKPILDEALHAIERYIEENIPLPKTGQERISTLP